MCTQGSWELSTLIYPTSTKQDAWLMFLCTGSYAQRNSKHIKAGCAPQLCIHTRTHTSKADTLPFRLGPHSVFSTRKARSLKKKGRRRSKENKQQRWRWLLVHLWREDSGLDAKCELFLFYIQEMAEQKWVAIGAHKWRRGLLEEGKWEQLMEWRSWRSVGEREEREFSYIPGSHSNGKN